MMRKIYDKVRSDEEFKDLTWEEFHQALGEVLAISERDYMEFIRESEDR